MSRSAIAFALEGQCQTCPAGSTPCDDCGTNKFNVCRICIRPIRKGEVPQLARINGLGFKEAPAELNQLNCIESLFIQKARVIQTIVNLKDIGGRTTATKGCGGPMIVVPVNVQESVNTILETLPSALNMRIIVNTEWDKQYLVCIERVLKALTWLKANNPEYHDIRIDPAFTLRLGRDVVFEDSSKTQEDVDSLIRRSESDGGSILESSTLVQPIQPVNQPPGTSLTGLKQFQLKRITNAPFHRDEPKADVWAFPKLFPTGEGGLHSERQ
ncbi:hypothetical protein B9Z55_000603 [Caenorhabditis nigoni]|uniref:DUF6570 domain-containing protein n=1 Tax=Caenorhabditis nigoni TaxID=1611254 RepID=A0A2G5VUM0_9PELO|nr:hypothetical protein B9Z55_000603 [Caenorhabditis nigoni]